jgi:hypothetical protein
MANEIFLRLVLDLVYEYAAKDTRYITAANTITINKFGPSGSLKSENVNLESTRDVKPKIINDVFFDPKFIIVIILKN